MSIRCDCKNKQIVTWISRFKYGDPDDLAYQRQIIDIFINAVSRMS